MQDELINFFTAPETYLALLISVAWVYLLIIGLRKFLPQAGYTARIIFSIVTVLSAALVYVLGYVFTSQLLQ